MPAALNGIIGIKPTLGIIPTHGVVPACADYDTVTVFAAELPTAALAIATMIRPDARDPRSRRWPSDAALAAPETPRLAIPTPENLAPLTDTYRTAFQRGVQAATAAGASIDTVDISTLLDAARRLYDGAIVAERYAAVGEFLDTNPSGADPTVAAIITAARSTTGAAFAADLHALAYARGAAAELLGRFDALLLPTITEHPSLAAVAADPAGINRRMGTFTNFCNLLDLAAIAIPAAPLPDASRSVSCSSPRPSATRSPSTLRPASAGSAPRCWSMMELSWPSSGLICADSHCTPNYKSWTAAIAGRSPPATPTA
ncbi:Allophanate hydrolase [Mycobacterium marinum]|uniref:Allophanate hydrolase n=1 Tax=Mycobacterium marinum TaxID=1781 RepID=A0A3E2N314_MYCMR|nr:Allophanate hydrolase [Mycobacterium marinum]